MIVSGRYSKSTLLWMAVFVFLPLIDLLTGYMISNDRLAAGSVASPSQWGRILLVYILVTYSLHHKGITSYILVLLAFCFLTEIIAGMLVGSLSGFISGVGLQYSVSTYATYVLPVLSYVGQLCPVPQAAMQAEAVALRALVAGPANWCAQSESTCAWLPRSECISGKIMSGEASL